MNKGIIYYTDNRLEKPMFSLCQKYMLASNLPIVSVSLRPIDFGNNTVIQDEPGYSSMIKQIVTALEVSTAEAIFFCEHDVLYHKSHFDFTPFRDDVFYYNMNNWRWDYPKNRVIKYNELTSLSQLCVNRHLALRHFKKRRAEMIKVGLEYFRIKDPHQARLWGYEPGRKKKRNGALFDEKSGTWNSKLPNIDIRHQETFSLRKVALKDFQQRPSGWIETTADKVPGWNLIKLFNLEF